MIFQDRLVLLVRVACRRPAAVVLGVMLLALAAGVYAAGNFALSTNTAALISPSIDWRQDEDSLNRNFPSITNTTLVVIDGATPELAEQGAAQLAARLETDRARIISVRRPDGGDFFARNGLLFGSEADVRKASADLVEAQPLLGPLAADPSLRGVAGAFDTIVTGVEARQTKLELAQPAMDAISRALSAQAQGKPAYFSWMRLFAKGDGALTPPTRRLLLIRPVLDFGALMPGARGSAAIQEAARALKLDQAHGVTVQITGAVPLADEEFASIAENISMIALLMLLLMLATLWLATHSVRMVAAIFVTTLLGLILTTATGLAAVGSFNLISVAFIPLFVGLGIDFGIQLAVRFNADRTEGDAPAKAMERAAGALGGPLLLAAGAVFLGFGAFLPTAYTGIAELGVIAGLGMIIALVLALTLLPALLMLFKPGRPRGDTGMVSLAKVDHWLARHRRLVLGSFVVAMIASIASLPLVRFDFNPLHLRSPDGPAMRTLANLMHDPLRTPNVIDVVAKDAASARAIAANAARLPEVAQVVSIDSFVPDDQPPKLAAIADAQLLLDVTLNPFDVTPPPSDAELVSALSATAARLIATGRNEGGAAGDSAVRLGMAFAHLAQAAPAARMKAGALLTQPLGVMLDTVRASLQAEAVALETLPPELIRDWVAPNGAARVSIFPRGDSNDNAVLARFTQAVSKVAPHGTGLPVTSQRAASTIAGAFIQAGALALALISLLLFLALRSMREVAFTLAPVILSVFLTLGTCVVIGQPINFANIIAFPLLFGVGVAFHIYFVMAWRGGAGNLLQSSLARGVMFSAIATGSAFGSLWLSAHPGTASMGKILMLSLAWTLVCALIFEPALLGPPRAKDQTRGPNQN